MNYLRLLKLFLLVVMVGAGIINPVLSVEGAYDGTYEIYEYKNIGMPVKKCLGSVVVKQANSNSLRVESFTLQDNQQFSLDLYGAFGVKKLNFPKHKDTVIDQNECTIEEYILKKLPKLKLKLDCFSNSSSKYSDEYGITYTYYQFYDDNRLSVYRKSEMSLRFIVDEKDINNQSYYLQIAHIDGPRKYVEKDGYASTPHVDFILHKTK